MEQTQHTEETESFQGYKDKGLKWGEINEDLYDKIEVLQLFPDNDLTNILVIRMVNRKLGLSEINKCGKLKNLFLYECNDSSFLKEIKDLSIKFLSFPISRFQNLQGIDGLTALTEMDIKWNRKITSLSGLEQLQSLEKFEIENCSHLEDLGKITEIGSLQWAKISHCGKKWLGNVDKIIKRFEKRRRGLFRS